jgi:hypothetical protein
MATLTTTSTKPKVIEPTCLTVTQHIWLRHRWLDLARGPFQEFSVAVQKGIHG